MSAPKKEESKFVNPFDKGVSYEDFLSSVPKGVSIKNHLKDFPEDQVNWIEEELNHFKNNKKR